MKLTPTEQAFFDIYSGCIAQCDDPIILIFLESERSDEGQDAFYEKYSEYYTHLKDTYIAFEAGIEYGRKNAIKNEV